MPRTRAAHLAGLGEPVVGTYGCDWVCTNKGKPKNRGFLSWLLFRTAPKRVPTNNTPIFELLGKTTSFGSPFKGVGPGGVNKPRNETILPPRNLEVHKPPF